MRAGVRQDWRGLVVLMLITALAGGVVLTALAGARRTQTAVSRFVQYSGPTEGEVDADPATLAKVARLPDVAYTSAGALMLAAPTTAGGQLAAGSVGSVLTWAIINWSRQGHLLVVAGRVADPSQPDEVLINESAAQSLRVRVGSVIPCAGSGPTRCSR